MDKRFAMNNISEFYATVMEKSAEKVSQQENVAQFEEKLDFDDDTLKAIAEVYKNEGNEEYRKKEFGNAIYFYTEGIKVNCKDEEMNAKLYSNRATAHFYQGNYHESLNDARVATELQPTYFKATVRGASACVELGLYAEAITWCDKGLTINQKNRMLFDLRCRSVVGLKSTKPETTASTPASQTVKNQELTKMLEPIREDIKKWIDCYESCLKKATETGDRSTERNTSYCLGRVYGIPGDFEKAIPYFERSLKLTKEVEDKSIEGLLYESLGLAYYGLGDFRKAIYYLERCLQFANDMKNKSAEGVENSKLENPYLGFGDVKTATKCYNIYLEHFANRKYWCIERSVYRFLGDAYGKLGYFKKAINCHEHYLKIDKEVEHKKEELSVCENLGSAYESLGDFKKALFYYELCLEIARHVKNRSAEEEAYSNLARTYFSLGDIKKAVDYDENALKIAIEMGDKDGEGRAYGNLGTSYHSLGEFKKAIECHERCLKIARDSKNRLVEGRVYGYLGAAFFRLGNFKIAIEYYEHRLEIAKEVGDRKGEGYGYGNLGNTYAVLGNFKKAIDCYERRLKIAIEIRDRLGEGHAYLHLGNCYKALGDVSKAKEHYELQLEIANETGEKGPDGKAYCALGQCYFKIREVQKSIHYMELGLKIAKQMDDMSAVGEAYELLGSIHESVGSLHEALQCFQVSVEAFEKVRIRLQSEDEWKISLRDVHQDAYTALVRVLLKLDRSVEALCAAEKGRAQALKELMESYFGIRRTETMSSAEEKTIQGIIREIPFNTIFLAFDQGVLNLWVIQNGKDVQRRVNEVGDLNTRDHYASFLQELVESTFESIGVRAAINCEDRSLGELRKPSLTKKISHETQSHSSQSRQHQLRRLYDVIMDPIADLIHGDEIIIVPEGPLWLVPYAALMDPNSRFLSDSFRVRVIPSLTSFKLISDCPADYHSKSGALVVGDPWVQEVVIDEGQKLDQLPDARREVEEIGRILNTETLTGKDATKNEVLKRLSTVALVHIAAHGRMETGEIALCPNPSRASRVPKDKDFLLTMNDVMNVKLTARLVVLSCCHSGRGEIKAEGVVGIARAFLGAGARSVLVSLWAIDDEATLEFMKSFYQHLVEGKSAGEALNQAMKCMRESENFSEVKYWAPFVLIGDDVTLEFPESD